MENINIQRVLHFIQYHFAEDLPLEILAKQAFLSPFHFHRVFKEAVGETPKQYITRVRLEVAAHLIVMKPETTILSVALDCGYNSQQSFSRAFKKYYSISPDTFRKMDEEERLKVLRNKTHKEKPGFDLTSFLSVYDQKSILSDLSISVEKLPSRNLIFIPTTLGSTTQIVKSFKRVKQWAEVRELTTDDSESFGLFMGFPLFTALDKCRYLTCISLDTKPKLSGNIQFMKLPARTYASFEVKGEINEMLKRVTTFAQTWLPESGYDIVHEPGVHVPKYDIASVPFNKNTFRLYLRIQPN